MIRQVLLHINMVGYTVEVSKVLGSKEKENNTILI